MVINKLAKIRLGRKLIKQLNLGSYQQLLELELLPRPHYAYCLYHGAILAKKLGYEKISVLEFGVAGGNGLINLEYHSQKISDLLGIEIEIYGFDTGEGLPKPNDYRDLPYHWQESFFKMDIAALKAKLNQAQLILGDIRDTATNFFTKYNPAPIAAIMYDLDYYSSTVSAFQIFDEDEKFFLPRIYCYLDDIQGSEIELYNDYTGVRLAINEFNQRHTLKKLSPAYHLITKTIVQSWYHHIYTYHNFEHSKYNQFISKDNQCLPLEK